APDGGRRTGARAARGNSVWNRAVTFCPARQDESAGGLSASLIKLPTRCSTPYKNNHKRLVVIAPRGTFSMAASNTSAILRAYPSDRKRGRPRGRGRPARHPPRG